MDSGHLVIPVSGPDHVRFLERAAAIVSHYATIRPTKSPHPNWDPTLLLPPTLLRSYPLPKGPCCGALALVKPTLAKDEAWINRPSAEGRLFHLVNWVP